MLRSDGSKKKKKKKEMKRKILCCKIPQEILGTLILIIKLSQNYLKQKLILRIWLDIQF